MRFLCLHGQGTSAAVFRSQTARFRSRLPSDYTFDFIDAPFSCPPYPGIDLIYPEPKNFSFWRDPSVPNIRAAHTWLLDLLHRSGPYDGALCFSQGCSLVSSLLLYHAAETPSAPLPFKTAIFICGGIPLTVLDDLGLPISLSAWDISDHTGRLLLSTAANLHGKAADPSSIKPGVSLWDEVPAEDLDHDPTESPPLSDVYGLDFNSFPENLKIKIPTVHIYGAKDPKYVASVQLVHFCEENRRTFDHGGGHDVPRRTGVSERIAELVEWAAGEVQRGDIEQV